MKKKFYVRKNINYIVVRQNSPKIDVRFGIPMVENPRKVVSPIENSEICDPAEPSKIEVMPTLGGLACSVAEIIAKQKSKYSVNTL